MQSPHIPHIFPHLPESHYDSSLPEAAPAADGHFSREASRKSRGTVPQAVATTVGDTVAEMFSFALEVSDSSTNER